MSKQLPLDITMCANMTCPLRSLCRCSVDALPADDDALRWQTIFRPRVTINGLVCDHFIPRPRILLDISEAGDE